MTEQENQNADNQGINISIEQICAAILFKSGKVELTVEELIKDYSKKTIAVTQDEDTKNLTFELTDIPVEAESE